MYSKNKHKGMNE